MNKEKLQESIEMAWSAVKASKLEDDQLKSVAFGVILRHLLEVQEPRVERKISTQTRRIVKEKPPRTEDRVTKILSSSLDYTPFDTLLNKGNWLDRSVVVLKVVDDKLGIKGLIPSELEQVMKKQLRLPSVYRTNISNSLGSKEARKITDRVKEGQAYRYSLTRYADGYIKKREKELQKIT